MDRRMTRRRAAAAWMLIFAITGVPLFFLLMIATAHGQAPVKTGPLLRQLDGSDINNPATFRTNLGLGTIAIQNPAAVAITGGTINGTSIGATTRSTGAFTTGAFSGPITVTGSATLSSTLSVTGTATIGGAVSGRSFSVPLSGFPAFAGDNPVPALAAFRTAFSGWTRTLGSYVTMGSSSDSVQLLRGLGGSMDYLNVSGRVAAGYQGGRTAIDGSVLEPADAPTSRFKWTTGIIGGKFSATTNNASGGVADGFGVTQFGAGTATALNPLVLIAGQNKRSAQGVEVDVKASAGATFFDGNGILVAQTPGHAVGGIKDWAAIRIANAGGVIGGEWKSALQIGSNGSKWPVVAGGSLISARIGNAYTTAPAVTGSALDLREASFTDYVAQYRGGEIRQGDHGGAVQVGYATLGSRSTGAYLDTGVRRTSGVTLANPGAGYSPTDLVGTARGVMIKVESTVSATITAVSQGNPARVTAPAHGLANGTMFDVSVDDPEAETGSCVVMSGMSELACQTIVSITNANPGLFTVTAHGLPNGAFARLSSVGGMTQLTGMPYYVVRPVSANTFTLEFPDGTPVDTTLFDTYTSGGKVRISYQVANADADSFDLHGAQGGNVSSANWSAYVSGGRVITYIPDQVSLLIPDWSTTPEGAGTATTHRTRSGRQYGSGLTVDLTSVTVTPLRIQSGGNQTYVGGVLAGAGTTSGLLLQTRGTVQARTATVASATVVDGGEFTSAPSLVVAAPPGSGTTATATVATMGGKGVATFAGGSNYTVGQIVTLVGGSSTQTSQFRVTAVDDPLTGVPTAVALYRVGSYSVIPSSPVSVATSGPGTGITISPTWTILTATVTGAGSNYAEMPPAMITHTGGGQVMMAEIEAVMAGVDAALSLNPSGAATVAGGPIAVGGGSLAVTGGALGLARMTASAAAPGAGGGKVELVCGTNAGTAKLIIYAGTSGTAAVLGDNIGSGVTGC